MKKIKLNKKLKKRMILKRNKLSLKKNNNKKIHK